MSEKIYIGSGKKKTFNNGGEIISITIGLDGLKELYEKYGFETDAGKKKLKLNVSARREVDQYGNTHYVTVDTWKPEQQPASGQDDFEDDTIPF